MQWQTIELLNQLAPTPPNLGTWIRTDRAQVIGGWLVADGLSEARDRAGVAQLNC